MGPAENLIERVRAVTLKLLSYCQENDWAGYDPYDGLNSKIFKSMPFLDFRIPRLILIQALKRLPINIRPLLLIPKTQNPKAIALFLMALLKLDKLGLLEDRNLIPLMVDRLIALRSPQELVTQPPSLPASQPPSNELSAMSSERSSPHELSAVSCEPSYWCWGYSFPWQTRTVLVPRGAPNLVCTCFVANALLDAYEARGESDYLEMASGAAEYILEQLYWTEGDSVACFAYPLPSSRARVHNANFLGAAVLSRLYKVSGEERFLEPCLKVARYSAAKQRDDGSWAYGEWGAQQWTDNFHTGYNLCALRTISESLETTEFEACIGRGFEFYHKHFFTKDGAPKYFHDRVYPIDVHSVAQSIITLLAFKGLDESNVSLACSVFRWAMARLWNEQGYFYYQVLPVGKIRISYMRWSQAWMLLAFSWLLEELEKKKRGAVGNWSRPEGKMLRSRKIDGIRK